MSKQRHFTFRFTGFAVLVWIAGIVLAKGFWSTLAAVFLPPWSRYLVVERGMRALGWI